MISTMSLAARICSRVAEENRPAIVSTRYNGATKLWQRDFPFFHFLGLRVGRFDQEKSEVLFDPGASQGIVEHLRLERIELGKEIGAEFVVLVLLIRPDFCGGVSAGIEESQRGDQDAGKADHPGDHA